MGSCRLSALDFTTHAVSLPVNRVCSFVVEALRKAQPQMLHPDDPLNPPNSQAEDLNFSDIPNGLAALKVVPFAGRVLVCFDDDDDDEYDDEYDDDDVGASPKSD